MYKIMFMVVIRLYAFQFFSNWNLSMRYTKCVESKSGFHLVFGMRFWLAFDGPEISWPVLARIWKYFNISISCMIWIDYYFFLLGTGQHRPFMASESFKESQCAGCVGSSPTLPFRAASHTTWLGCCFGRTSLWVNVGALLPPLFHT